MLLEGFEHQPNANLWSRMSESHFPPKVLNLHFTFRLHLDLKASSHLENFLTGKDSVWGYFYNCKEAFTQICARVKGQGYEGRHTPSFN